MNVDGTRWKLAGQILIGDVNLDRMQYPAAMAPLARADGLTTLTTLTIAQASIAEASIAEASIAEASMTRAARIRIRRRKAKSPDSH